MKGAGSLALLLAAACVSPFALGSDSDHVAVLDHEAEAPVPIQFKQGNSEVRNSICPVGGSVGMLGCRLFRSYGVCCRSGEHDELTAHEFQVANMLTSGNAQRQEGQAHPLPTAL